MKLLGDAARHTAALAISSGSPIRRSGVSALRAAQVWGALDETDIDTVIERIGNAQIVWINPVAAAGRNWGSKVDFAVYAQGIFDPQEQATRVIQRSDFATHLQPRSLGWPENIARAQTVCAAQVGVARVSAETPVAGANAGRADAVLRDQAAFSRAGQAVARPQPAASGWRSPSHRAQR